MDRSIEEHFVHTFIRKNRRERLLHELTTPGKRYRGIDRFSHQAREMLDPGRIVMEGEDLERRPEFGRFVREHDELCHVLSTDFRTAAPAVPLKDAVRMAEMSAGAVLILGSTFAVVFAEFAQSGRDKFILSEEGTGTAGSRPAR